MRWNEYYNKWFAESQLRRTRFAFRGWSHLANLVRSLEVQVVAMGTKSPDSISMKLNANSAHISYL